jgi:uncharacterized Rmd1/YagE family protein
MPDTQIDDVQDTRPTTITAHAVLLADRLTVDRSHQPGVVSAAPFCYRAGSGYVVIFRYGAVVLVGLTDAQEKTVLSQLMAEATVPAPVDEERLVIALRPDEEEGVTDTGRLQVRDVTQAHVLVLADILAKSVALARYEREIGQVFDTIEPAANTLAVEGRIPSARRSLLKLIGSALLAQHRVSGRIAFAEKPDALWDHPELERFYARLEDEYEIVERGTLLNGKVGVIATAAETFTDLVDTARSARLELLIVVLILAEIVIGAVTMFHI